MADFLLGNLNGVRETLLKWKKEAIPIRDDEPYANGTIDNIITKTKQNKI